MTPNLEKLWVLSGEPRNNYKVSENPYFDPIGLILLKEPIWMGYWCTPTNTISFATTGGDGVHFGFLCESDGPTDHSAIVMTIPMAETANIIIGGNFREFLCMGCRAGFFGLEQIEYQPENHIALLDSQSYSSDTSAQEIELLKKIEHEFVLKPINKHKARLAELKRKYHSRLEHSDEYYEIMT